MKNIYTIPSDVAFVDALAEGLLQRAGGDHLKLADSLILLPTRRSCRHLREAFLRQMKTSSALLPRLQPLGDIDEEELYFSAAGIDPAIPPAISPLRRQLLLTHLVSAKDEHLPLDAAAQLAKALGKFLDQVQAERLDLGRLDELVEQKDLAEHWKQTVAFLDILTKAWPAMLAEEGSIDPIDRQNRVLEAQTKTWKVQPPPFPVIAAGTTGSLPATSDLLDVIASMPQGALVLPGLDLGLDEAGWQAIEESHPQYGMKRLLEKCGIKREAVRLWPAAESRRPHRARLLQTIMRPPDVSDDWRRLKASDIPFDALKGLARCELDHPQEEAQAIALLMRETLETPGKTAMLVTPDRGLAERVLSLLRRWAIEANDSAGSSLTRQPIGAFLSDILAAASPRASPVDLLSLLKHPFAALGLSPAECRARTREIEMKVWRSDRPEKCTWLADVENYLKPLAKDWNTKLPLHKRLRAHIDLAEKLAASDTESGSDRLWRFEAGTSASEWLSDLETAAPGFPPLTGDDYRNLFLELSRAVIVRPTYGQHPRLSILGPLEARLIHADRIILGGLNEGTWPPEDPIDPWMSRPMKKAFGLPSPERRIGLSAHDFVQLSCAEEVFLTRSRRSGNAPTVPSRFLLQLETVIEALGYSSETQDALAPGKPWNVWLRLLDEPEGILSCEKPEPRPALDARPKQLSVTEIGTWRRNPYAIYAKHILKLKKLEELEAEIDAADRGAMIHEALDVFLKAHPDQMPDQAYQKLLDIGRQIFAKHEEKPEVKAFWWPRFERIAAWFVDLELKRRSEGIKLLQAEAEGKIAIGGFTLKGRADRIDRLPEGALAVIDYKTGHVPSVKEVKAGYEPQLPLLSHIAAKGGFKGIKPGEVGELAYWKLSGGRKVAEIKPVGDSEGKLADDARQGLEQLIETFANVETPYQAVPKPRFAPRYDDYAHLARLKEWGRTTEEGGGE